MTSTIKVNNIQNQCGANILNESSNTITIGASGDTVSLASGASQSGFGRTGTVDWQTTPKTATFTAVNGEGYFCNTTAGSFEVDLPAGSAGAIVSVQDYNNTFDSNSLTIDPNGSEKINGGAGSLVLSTEGQGLTLVYIDSTVGWRSIHSDDFATVGSDFIVATGGTETTSGNCKIHTFTGPGTFTVTAAAATAANNVVSHLVVAGGGGGGGDYGGGGGAGGYREVKSPVTPYTASPLDGYPSAPNRVTVTAQTYPIAVGGGGNKGTRDTSGTDGSNSSFSTITSAGGGKGGMQEPGCAGKDGGNGGSGGGARYGPASVGSGNTPPVTPPQGNNGGLGHHTNAGGHSAGGGGGAGAVGQSAPSCCNAGDGGNGVTTSISATPTAYAGGGGGGGGGAPFPQPYTAGTGGTGGGGAGAPDATPGVGTAGTVNTGGGGGGGNRANPTSCGGAGGSGIVIIRYKYQ